MLFKKKLASKVYFSKFIQIKKLAKEKKEDHVILRICKTKFEINQTTLNIVSFNRNIYNQHKSICIITKIIYRSFMYHSLINMFLKY